MKFVARGVLVVVVLMLAPQVVLAQAAKDSELKQLEQAQERHVNTMPRGMNSIQPDKPAPAKAALDASCKPDDAKLVAVIARINTRAQGQLELFDQISRRSRAYYSKNNLTAANYAAQVAAVDASQATATAAVTQAQASQKAFSCQAGNRAQLLATIRTDFTIQATALKDYQAAAKAQIAEIKAAKPQSTTQKRAGQ